MHYIDVDGRVHTLIYVCVARCRSVSQVSQAVASVASVASCRKGRVAKCTQLPGMGHRNLVENQVYNLVGNLVDVQVSFLARGITEPS